MSRSVHTTQLRLPACVEDIDAAFLTAALSERHPGVRVDSVVIGGTYSGTSSTVRLTLGFGRNDPGLPERMLLKGSFALHEFAAGDLSAVEARFYRDVASLLGDDVNRPIGYFGGVDSSGRAVVVTEDLTDREVEFAEATDAVAVDEVAQGVEQLAALHARFWQPDTLRPFPWLGRISDIVAIMRYLVSPDHFALYPPCV